MALKAEESSGAHRAVGYITMWQNGKACPQLVLFGLWRLWVSEFPPWPIGKDRLVSLEANREEKSLVLFFKDFIYLKERERERAQWGRGRWRERES